jgi:hypothetical protein
MQFLDCIVIHCFIFFMNLIDIDVHIVVWLIYSVVIEKMIWISF